MFHGGGPPRGRYPRQYGPNCGIPAPFNQSQGPSMATGFGAQVGSYNQPPGVPCGPFVPRQFDSNRYTFPAFYFGNSEASRSSSAGLSFLSPGPGNGQGPCSAAPGENVGLQLNPSLPSAGFSGEQTQTSVSNDPLDLQVYRKVNCPSQDDIENERAGEEFLRCLAAKEKLPVRDRAADWGDPLYRTGNGQGQESGAEDQASKRLGRSKSRPRSRSRSRGKSMGRSKSRPPSLSRSRGKSVGRSKSRPRSRSRSRGKSVGRSKSRPRSRSRSRGKSLARSKSRPRSRSPHRAKSQAVARSPSRSCSGTSSSSSNLSITIEGPGRTAPPSKNMAMDMFQELLLGGQLKDQEALLALSKVIALKKQLRTGSHGQTSIQTSQSPVNIFGEHRSSSLPRETQSLPRTVTKGIDPSLSASIQGQTGEPRHVQTMDMEGGALNAGQYAKLFGAVKQEAEEENVGEFLLPHERVRHDSSGFSRILGMMGDMPHLPEKRKLLTDIEDEEAFLYGEEDKAKVTAKSVAGEQAAAVDFNRVKKALMTIGLDLGKADIGKMVARKQEQQTNHISESPQHKGVSSSGGMCLGQSRGLKRNISPSLDMFSDSHSSAKQALYSGVPSGSVREERDTSSQEKGSRGIPFFTSEEAERPLATPNTLTSPFGFETGILGKIPPSMAEAWPQKPIVPAPHFPAVDLQLLEPLKGVLESMKATSKASGMDMMVDLANQSGNVRTSQKQKSSGWNTKVNEDALEQMRRKDYLLQELESLLRREGGSIHNAFTALSPQIMHFCVNRIRIDPISRDMVDASVETLTILIKHMTEQVLMVDAMVTGCMNALRNSFVAVSEFVAPVIGFCCKLCEEFFGDVASAQEHASCQSHKEKCMKQVGRQDRSAGDRQSRPAADTERRDRRESEHKWSSKEERKTYRETGEKFSVKAEKLEGRVASGPGVVTPSGVGGRKETDSAKGSVTDRDRSSSKTHKKKKKKKEKKKLKKEKKKGKKERERNH